MKFMLSLYLWFIHSHCCSVVGQLGSFQLGALTKSAAMNILTLHMSFGIHTYICTSVGYIYRNEIAGSKNSHIVSFSRYC